MSLRLQRRGRTPRGRGGAPAFAVVEQSSASERAVETRTRWSSSERQRASVETSSRLGSSRVERRSDGERYGAGDGSAPGQVGRRSDTLRWSSSERQRLSRWSSVRRTVRRHRVLSNGIRRHRTAPGHVHDRRRLPDSSHEVADLGLWTLSPAETEANLTALARAAAPDHRARAPPRPPRRPPRPRRSSRRRRHRQPSGPTRPGRPHATRSDAWASRTPWTTTTNRSGTRWPPAPSPRTRPR